MTRIKCFKCEKMGYFADMCPSTEEGVVQNIITDVIGIEEEAELGETEDVPDNGINDNTLDNDRNE